MTLALHDWRGSQVPLPLPFMGQLSLCKTLLCFVLLDQLLVSRYKKKCACSLLLICPLSVLHILHMVDSCHALCSWSVPLASCTSSMHGRFLSSTAMFYLAPKAAAVTCSNSTVVPANARSESVLPRRGLFFLLLFLSFFLRSVEG